MGTHRVLYHVLLCFVLVGSFAIGPTVSAKDKAIDVTRDANGDGLPDALVEEVQRIQSVVSAVTASRAAQRVTEEQAKGTIEAAIANSVSRLPYSAKTRALQQRAASLQARLSEARDAAQAQQIIGELRAVGDQMMADPAYAATINALTRMFAPPGAIQGSGTLRDASADLPAIAAEPLKQPKARDAVRQSAIAPQAANYDWLYRGDIMVIRSGIIPWNAFVYAMWYTHSGVYDGGGLVYSSNTSGVTFELLQDWKKPYQYVGLGINRWTTYAQDWAALDWAKGVYGTDTRSGYNYNFAASKDSDTAWPCSKPRCLYCSQLTWKIQKYNNVDVDSNSWSYLYWVFSRWGLAGYYVAYTAVAPDEVNLDSDVSMYSAGWN